MRPIPRILQIAIGLFIFVSLVTTVSTEDSATHLLIWKIITPAVLKTIAWICLLLISIRLMYGRLIHDGESSSFILKAFNRLWRHFTDKPA